MSSEIPNETARDGLLPRTVPIADARRALDAAVRTHVVDQRDKAVIEHGEIEPENLFRGGSNGSFGELGRASGGILLRRSLRLWRTGLEDSVHGWLEGPNLLCPTAYRRKGEQSSSSSTRLDPAKLVRMRPWLGRRLCFATTVSVAACGGAPSGHSAKSASAITDVVAAEDVGPSRVLVLPAADDIAFSERDSDGTRRGISHGIRFIEYPDGHAEYARDVFPNPEILQTLSLPDRLGRGYLFYASDEEGTSVWRSESWTGRANPVVRLATTVSQIAAGFDRLYAISRRTGGVAAIEADSGKLLELGPIPPSASYGGMAFADSWMAAVEVDMRGVLVTFDAGASFTPAALRTTLPGVSSVDGHIVLNTTEGRYVMETDGSLRPIDTPERDSTPNEDEDEPRRNNETAPGDVEDVAPPPGLLGPRPLARAVLRGMPISHSVAVVAENGVLAKVGLANGRVLDAKRDAYPEGGPCQTVKLGTGVGFVCGGDGLGTVVYRYVPPLGMDAVLRFREPRFVATADNGALAIRGNCKSTGAPLQRDTYCIVQGNGSAREIRVKGDVGAERVAAMRDGRVVVLVPPRLGAAGALTVIGPDGSSVTKPLMLPAPRSRARRLVETGLWMEGFTEAGHGEELRGWIVGAGPFAGASINMGGEVRVGPIQSGVDNTILSGRFALMLADGGSIRETSDHGLTWRELGIPTTLSDAMVAPPTTVEERGCTAVGCAFGPWVKVGWGAPKDGDELTTAVDPRRAEVESARFVNWTFQCSPTGESSPPVLGRAPRADTSDRLRLRESRMPAISAARPPATPRQDVVTGAWRPFLGLAGPPLPPASIGLDFGTEDHVVQVRGYAWGPADGRWESAGRWLVRAIDRFEVEPAIWSTAISRTPWSDAIEAAPSFGGDPSHRSITEWASLVDPSSDGGVLFLRAAQDTDVYVLEKDKPIVRVRDTEQFGLEQPAGAVKVGDAWYVGSVPSPRTFRIIKIQGGRATLAGSYPRQSEGPAPQLVRSARGDAIGIWIVGKGQYGSRGGGDTWYVFPVDRASGEAGAPIQVSRDLLVSAPRPCEPDDDGWQLVHSVNPTVTNLDFVSTNHQLKASRLEARLLVNDGSVCVNALAAQVEDGPVKDVGKAASLPTDRATVTLALTDRAADRRWGFRCSP